MAGGFVSSVGKRLLLTAALPLVSLSAGAKNIYVWTGSPSPLSPFGSWNTASRSLQKAIDAASTGDTVWVTNGVYSGFSTDKSIIIRSVLGAGVTMIDGGGTNRCAKLGAAGQNFTNTVVIGFTMRNGSLSGQYGGGALGGTLQNCTFTNNTAMYGGAVSGGSLSECLIVGNSAYYGGGAHQSTLSNCLIVGNSAAYGGGTEGTYSKVSGCTYMGNKASIMGGGANGGVIDGCTLAANSAPDGGGARWATLLSCLVISNAAERGGGSHSVTMRLCRVSYNKSAAEGAGIFQTSACDCDISRNAVTNWGHGGGAFSSTVYRCTIRYNTGTSAGGVAYGSASNCQIIGNSVTHGIAGGMEYATANESVIASNSCVLAGGGAYGGSLRNCLVFDNVAYYCEGGGTYVSDTVNCTIVRNRSGTMGGGVYGGVHESSIIYFNTAVSGDNYGDADLRYCCTTPDFNVQNCFAGEPLFFNAATNDFRLRYGSPCIDRRTVGVLVPFDQVLRTRPLDGNFDGQGAYDIGALEYDPSAYDTDSDSIPDSWEHANNLDPLNPADAFLDADDDFSENRDEFVADTDPRSDRSYMRVTAVTNAPKPVFYYPRSAARLYGLERRTNLLSGAWMPVPGQTDVSGAAAWLTDTNPPPGRAFYKVNVRLP
ncbi:MAG: right-handed parallel beta-helix repeat-containing protein [Kiritimatiellia bacterium]|jgi:hypothetical protein|nr:right-handed parallel beta-helix repeat-containing protein [Kiritimatiellia bacterium]